MKFSSSFTYIRNNNKMTAVDKCYQICQVGGVGARGEKAKKRKQHKINDVCSAQWLAVTTTSSNPSSSVHYLTSHIKGDLF